MRRAFLSLSLLLQLYHAEGNSSAFLAEERSAVVSIVCPVLQRFWGLTRIGGAKNRSGLTCFRIGGGYRGSFGLYDYVAGRSRKDHWRREATDPVGTPWHRGRRGDSRAYPCDVCCHSILGRTFRADFRRQVLQAANAPPGYHPGGGVCGCVPAGAGGRCGIY